MTDDATGGTRTVRATPRWMLALLFTSLAVNLLVVGSVAGAMWRHRMPPVSSGPVIPNLMGYASTLPAERRKQLWEETAEERGHVRPFRRAVRAARDETIRALMDQPFDRQRFLEAQRRQSAAENQARAAVEQLYVKLAESLTPEERRAFTHWRDKRRTPVRNYLDEADHQAGDAAPPK
jgi:uncharacterized membrane protein